MVAHVEPNVVESVKEVADALKAGSRTNGVLGRAILLVGAGCSVSAGIPDVAKMARHMARKVAEKCCPANSDDLALYLALVAHCSIKPSLIEPDTEPTALNIDWSGIYDQLLRTPAFRTPLDVVDLFKGLLRNKEGAINWAHLCIGELAKRGYISTVLTTNVDGLVRSGLARAGVSPVVCDSIQSLDRIEAFPTDPQLVELHGSRDSYMRFAASDLKEFADDRDTWSMLSTLFKPVSTFIAVGYAGRENGFMDLLVELAHKPKNKNKNLYWTSYSDKPNALGPKARAFLASSNNGGLLLRRDADTFFMELCQCLDIGVPSAIKEPSQIFANLIDEIRRSEVTDRSIKAEIEAANLLLHRLRALEAEPKIEDPVLVAVNAIREARLAENYAKAYRLASEALSGRNRLTSVDHRILQEAALAALGLGIEQADQQVLAEAIERLKVVIEEWKGEDNDRAPWIIALGKAVWRLGELEPEKEVLAEAIEFLRPTIRSLDRNRSPSEWAEAQYNLGGAIATLARLEKGTNHFRDAVEAYEAALSEYDPAEVPQQYATAQNNLAGVLHTWGDSEPEATEHLKMAVEAYRAALMGLTEPAKWLEEAATKSNLAGALQTWGDRTPGEAGEEKLLEATKVYEEVRASYEERKQYKWQWANTQNNIGGALMSLGDRRTKRDIVEKAISVYEKALSFYDSEPARNQQRLITQSNLSEARTLLDQPRFSLSGANPSGAPLVDGSGGP